MAMRRKSEGARGPRPGKPGAGRPRAPLRGSRRRQAGVKVTPAAQAPDRDGKVRLNRFLSQAGVCSRRAADELIVAGRVSVNGTVERELGVRIDAQADEVRVDGSRVQTQRLVHILFNKPAGIVCTNAPNEQRRRVIDLIPPVRGHVFTVGRLDLDSEGLILVTNDGDFAQAMAHPSHGVPKTYAVLVHGKVDKEQVAKARGGVWLAEGRTGGARIVIERVGRDRTYLKVTLREGRNREIRRVFAKLGYPVLSLKRVRIGNLTLHGLSRGASRFLSKTEVEGLLEIARRDDA